MSLKGIITLLMLFACGFAHSVKAGCVYIGGSGGSTSVKELKFSLEGRTISVPPDVPVGQVIAQKTLPITGWQFDIRCTSTALNFYTLYRNPPKPLADGFSNIYQTNVPGIGVRYVSSVSGTPGTLPVINSFSPAALGGGYVVSEGGARYTFNASSVYKVIMEFVKTAPVTASGVQINPMDLPGAEIRFGYGPGDGSDNLPIVRFTPSASSLVITTPTCTIEAASANMLVKMGTHHTDDFGGVGTGTAWQDASIRLTNCAPFRGIRAASSTTSTSQSALTNTNPGVPSSYGVTTDTNNTLDMNTLELTLSPYEPGTVTQAANGIFNIDGGANAASGVAIQLSQTESDAGLINLNNKIVKSLPNDSAQSRVIPLYARYIQTDTPITGGVANGRLQYTITYQ